MKRQIRRGVFESNSSSVHALQVCSKDTYNKWTKGELYKKRWGNKFLTREEIIEELKTKKHWKSNELVYPDVNWNDEDVVNELINSNEYITEEEFWQYAEDSYFETFSETFTTEHGDVVEIFGYYGHD